MKEIEYYTTPKAQYHNYDKFQEILNRINEEINNTPMTAKERTDALSKASKQATAEYEKLNRPYKEELRRLHDEFHVDARAELQLDQLLTPAGISILERLAHEDGHAYGIPEIFEYMEKYASFIRDIKDEIK